MRGGSRGGEGRRGLPCGLLPYALSFAAGAIDLRRGGGDHPESQAGGHTDLATLGAILGLAVMMVLDVALA